MKVILLQDVAKIGKRFNIAEVPDGYALNQLIPKKMAEPATPANLKRIERHQVTVAAGKEAGEAQFETAVEALKEAQIKITAEANEQDHLFQAVHEADIVKAAAEVGITIAAAMVKITTPIKALGEHELDLVSGDKKHAFTIEVIKK